MRPGEPRPGWQPVLAGIGLAGLGHLLAIAAMGVAARLAGGARGSDVDLDAGGRFGVVYAMLCTYAVMQTFLLAGVLLLSAYGGQRLKVGLFAGWGGGLVLIVGVVASWFVPGAA
ncbi:hypothetical protein [Micromonospora sp. NPDC005367]|uniref:hypothetical protein n=1 Tax=Micromonospora sp. NPDC005367 TaxID=3155590 RepID=UPI0033B2E97B